jgi:hypothetical protein
MLQSCQWNQVKHLPVKLVRAPRHVFNMLRVEVLCYPREHGFVETEYASICFHLHELASHSFLRGDAPSPRPFPRSFANGKYACDKHSGLRAGNFDMYSNMTRVGQLQLELAFNYGLYGYGHSPQLSDAMGSFEQLPPELRVRHSLYPRVQPPDDRTDFASATLIPPAVTPFPMPMHARAGAHTHDHHPPTTNDHHHSRTRTQPQRQITLLWLLRSSPLQQPPISRSRT